MSKTLHFSVTPQSNPLPMLFGSLEEELRARLIAESPARAYGDGQFIQHRGSAPDGFWLIEEGHARLGQFFPDGEFRAVAVLGPGDSFGELAVLNNSPRVVDALARGESRIRFIAAARFLALLAQYPASSRALLAALSAQLQDSVDQLTAMRRGNNMARLASALSRMADEEGIARGTQQELAELLGVTRATVNGALRKLEKAGLVSLGYGNVRVVKRDALMMVGVG